MTLSAVVVTALIGSVLPLLVGLVTKLNASSKLKGGILIGLNAVQGFLIAGSMGGGDINLTIDTAVLWGVGILVSLASYYGLYKPADVSTKLAPGFGVGGSPTGV